MAWTRVIVVFLVKHTRSIYILMVELTILADRLMSVARKKPEISV